MKLKYNFFITSLLMVLLIFSNISIANENNLDINNNGGFGLDDVIYALQVISGMPEPPAFDISGNWDVKSFQEDGLRTGTAHIDMEPDGTIGGYANLTSLPGYSTITGRLSGKKLILHLTADAGTMSVTAFSDDGMNVSGRFSIQEGVFVDWTGEKRTHVKNEGVYTYNPLESNGEHLKVKFNEYYPAMIIKLTSNSITNLQNLGVDPMIIIILSSLVDQPFYAEHEFKNAVKKTIGDAIAYNYQDVLQQIGVNNILTDQIFELMQQNGVDQSVLYMIQGLKNVQFESFDALLGAISEAIGDGIMNGNDQLQLAGLADPLIQYAQIYNIVCSTNITETNMIWSGNQNIEWVRDSGVAGSILGKWKNSVNPDYYILFNEDGTVTYAEPIGE